MTGPAPVRRYHFHAFGLLYIGVALFLALGALNSQNNLLFAAMGLSLAALVVSGIVSGWGLMGLSVERLDTTEPRQGGVAAVRYAVTNRSRVMPVFGVLVTEAPAFGAERATWPGRVGELRGFIPHVGPGERVIVTAAGPALARGPAGLVAVRVWSQFPFGLARKSITFSQRGTLIVRPAVWPVRPGVLGRTRARARVGAGVQRASGGGDDFFGVREYTPGDAPRQIAWRPSARTDQLVVTLRAAPAPVTLRVVLRFSAAGRSRGADERAITVAASLAARAAHAGLPVGLSIPAAGVRLASKPGRGAADRVQRELGRIDPAVLSDPADEAAAGRRDRSAMVIVVHAGEPVASAVDGPTARHIGPAEFDAVLDWPAAPAGAGPARALWPRARRFFGVGRRTPA